MSSVVISFYDTLCGDCVFCWFLSSWKKAIKGHYCILVGEATCSVTFSFLIQILMPQLIVSSDIVVDNIDSESVFNVNLSDWSRDEHPITYSQIVTLPVTL